jgi:rhodanese-related sulfurtransferase
MRTRSILFALSLATTVVGAAACDKAKSGAKQKAAIAEITVDDLAKELGANTARAVDANGAKTRKDVGSIPGAVMLTDYETFAATELPADKSQCLVFYCANEQCGASHEAAGKAVALGYKNVKVLPAGIMGWVKSGQRVEKL